MREIKYRAYLKKSNQMVNVKSIHFGTNKIIVGYSKSKTNYGNYSVSFDDIELMQFTGLYDKNGKEIYEGDIFEIDDYTNGVVVYFEGEGTFGIRCKDDEDEWNEPFSYYCFDRMEVLGNECENPELLGE